MKFFLILTMLGVATAENGVVYPTLAECEAAGQLILNGQVTGISQ